VAALTHIGYEAWLQSPGRGGRERRPHHRRVAAESEFDLLPEWVWGWYESPGVPEGHPGLRR